MQRAGAMMMFCALLLYDAMRPHAYGDTTIMVTTYVSSSPRLARAAAYNTSSIYMTAESNNCVMIQHLLVSIYYSIYIRASINMMMDTPVSNKDNYHDAPAAHYHLFITRFR